MPLTNVHYESQKMFHLCIHVGYFIHWTWPWCCCYVLSDILCEALHLNTRFQGDMNCVSLHNR